MPTDGLTAPVSPGTDLNEVGVVPPSPHNMLTLRQAFQAHRPARIVQHGARRHRARLVRWLKKMPSRLLSGAGLACVILGTLTPAEGRPGTPAAGEFTLYRCGPDGRDLRDTPCPGATGASQAVRFQPDDPLSAQAARERGRLDGLLAERLRQERDARLAAEQQAMRDAPPGLTIGAAGQVTPRAAAASGSKDARREARTAKSPRPRKPKSATAASRH